ncbi:MAG: hypothetical protein B7Z02_02590 [Rhodobacterales bacterium 32-67-9]|nr:MAG: hypothetical protein B7Z02_02590 [Rhodobacterales bacterium 32-67-9]
MTFFRSLALLLAVLMAHPAAARPLDASEAKSLDTSLGTYLRAIGRSDAKGIVAALPPRVLNVFAGASGVETKKLETTLVEQTAALMKGTKVRDVTADQSALDAEEDDLADGTTVTWVLVPTAFVTEADGAVMQNEQPLLAVEDGEKWYFLRIDGPERQQLAALAYPFLAGRKFPASTVTAVK